MTRRKDEVLDAGKVKKKIEQIFIFYQGTKISITNYKRFICTYEIFPTF